MKPAYYNEFDAYCAAWLRNLIEAGLIPAGDVDERDIRDVRSDDLKGYGQVHLFAGIGGWAEACRLAGVPNDRPIWTASCPCPPFSVAGKQKTCPSCGSALLVPCPRRTGFFICADCGHAWDEDPRHLWPEAWRLIAECRPAIVFGEQVESVDGRRWLAGVRGSLEILGFAVAASDMCAASVGAPHPRQRLWWVADAGQERRGAGQRHLRAPSKQSDIGRDRETGGLAQPHGGHPSAEGLQRSGEHGQQPQDGGVAGGLGVAENDRSVRSAAAGRETGHRIELAGSAGFWSGFDLIPCGDEKARRVEPGTFPLAHGVPARVGKLRAYGNAIVPQLAAEFIQAMREAEEMSVCEAPDGGSKSG